MKKKFMRLIAFVAVISLLISSLVITSYANQSELSIVYNGNEILGITAKSIDSNVYLPIRGVLETLGVKVDWIAETMTVKCIRGENSASVSIGKNLVTVNGRTKFINEPSKLIGDRTYISVDLLKYLILENVEITDNAIYITSDIRELSFDDVTSLADVVVTKSGYANENIALSEEFVVGDNGGKSIKLSNLTDLNNGVIFKNFFNTDDVGYTFNLEMWVYSPEKSLNVRFGPGSESGQYSTHMVLCNTYSVNAASWTKVTLKYLHENENITTLMFDQLGGKEVVDTVYIDGIKAQKDNSSAYRNSSPNNRPVPTAFETSSSYDDIVYYSKFEGAEGTSNQDKLKALGEGKQMLTHDMFIEGGWKGEESANVEVVEVEGMPFKTAKRINVTSIPTNQWDVQIENYVPEENQPDEDDWILLVICARRISGGILESEQAQLQALIEFNPDIKGSKTKDHDKLLNTSFSFGNEWTYGYFPVKVRNINESTKEKPLWIPIRIAPYIQEFEIGDIQFINYGKDHVLEDFPTNGYEGISSTATWREEAFERIDNHRKEDLNIVVKDENGNVIPDAEVAVNMVEHEFMIGSTVSQIMAAPDTRSVHHTNFRNTVVRYFNGGTHEVATKWTSWVGEGIPDKVVFTNDWLKSKGVTNLRGHVLMVDTLKPTLLEEIADDKEKVDEAIKNHITDIMTKTKGDFYVWDVTNEQLRFYDNNDGAFTSRYGQDVVFDWHKWAREADGDVDLAINNLTPGPALLEYVKYLQNNNVELDSLGIECHGGFNTPESLYENLEVMREAGLPMVVTEYDTSISDPELYASTTRDFIITIFSHDLVDGFYTWGPADSAHWLKNSALCDSNWQLKPTGEQMVDLFYNKFWTRSQGMSNKDGNYNLRAFRGNYEITAAKDGKYKTISAVVKKGTDNNYEIVLE